MTIDWKIEDHKFIDELFAYAYRNEKEFSYLTKEKYFGKMNEFTIRHCIFSIENQMSFDEKLAVINELTNNAIDEIVDLLNKFIADKNSLFATVWGSIPSSSLSKWLKNNDKNHICGTNKNHVGMIDVKIPTITVENENWYLPRWYIQEIIEAKPITSATIIYPKNMGARYDAAYENFIDEAFHNICIGYALAEKEYLFKNDKHYVLAYKADDYIKRFGTFGANIKELPYIQNDSGETRLLTDDELQTIIDNSEEIESHIEKLSKNPILY